MMNAPVDPNLIASLITNDLGASAAATTNAMERNRQFSALIQAFLRLSDPSDSYTPIITASSGTFTSVSATGGYVRCGKLAHVRILITITTNGTAAGSVLATLPFTAAGSPSFATWAGRANAVPGKMLQGIVGSSATTISIFNYDNTYPGASGESLAISGWYETV